MAGKRIWAMVLVLSWSVSGLLHAQIDLPDSLATRFQTLESYYYIKPVWGQFRNESTLQGDRRFTPTYPGELFNANGGLMLGYHRNRLEVETGYQNLPVATGYLFPLLPINGPGTTGIGQGRRITYRQVPVLFRYTLWRMSKRLELRGVAGIGLVWSSGLRFNSNGVILSGVMGPDSVRRTTKTTTQSDNKKAFQIGTVGLDVQYQLSRRWAASLEVKRLLAPKSIVWIESTVEPHGENVPYKVRAVGSANGFSFQASLRYQFLGQRQYRPLRSCLKLPPTP